MQYRAHERRYIGERGAAVKRFLCVLMTLVLLLGSGQALTLDDYMNKGNVAPPTATVIRSLEEVTSWKCTICGYIAYKEELPDDYKCPICKAGKDKLVKQ